MIGLTDTLQSVLRSAEDMSHLFTTKLPERKESINSRISPK